MKNAKYQFIILEHVKNRLIIKLQNHSEILAFYSLVNEMRDGGIGVSKCNQRLKALRYLLHVLQRPVRKNILCKFMSLWR